MRQSKRSFVINLKKKLKKNAPYEQIDNSSYAGD